MNIALFGGTFDPIHSGHLEAASAAARRFRLDRILFIPTGNPPHKPRPELTPFEHRFAMVALGCAGDRRFVPSLLESPEADGRTHYSIDTTRRVRRLLGSEARLFFLIGADAFLDLPHWKDYRGLFRQVRFIVVSRPGFRTEEIRNIVPRGQLRSSAGGAPVRPRLWKSTLEILEGVRVPVASHEIRDAVRAGRRVTGLVPPLVEQYILKAGLYRPRRGGEFRRR